jgi:hypothetical protein
MRHFDDCSLDDLKKFFERLYNWGADGRSYNTQDSTKSILDCMIKLTDYVIKLKNEIEKLKGD